MNTNSNIENQEDDLKSIAPHLSKLKKDNPFKAGRGYFEDFPSKLQNQISSYEEIKEDAPALANLPKCNPFAVPENYFDELPTIIQQNVINQKGKTSILEWLILLIKPQFAIPVLTTLLIAIAGINYMNNNVDTSKPKLAEEITVEEQLYNIDETTIIESLNSQSGSETNAKEDDNGIKQYLIDNNIDETSLNNEL